MYLGKELDKQDLGISVDELVYNADGFAQVSIKIIFFIKIL